MQKNTKYSVIGGVVGVIVAYCLFFLSFYTMPIISWFMINPILSIGHISPESSDGTLAFNVIFVIFYFVIGAFVGWLCGKIINRPTAN